MKRWIILGVLVLLIVGGVIGTIVFNKAGNASTDGSTQIGTVQVSESDIIRVVFTHPPELTGKWEKPTLSIVNIELRGVITGSPGTVFKVHFLLDGQNVDAPWEFTVGPNGTVDVRRNIGVQYALGKKVLEIKVVTTSPPTTPPATTPPPTTTPPTTAPDTKIFTSAPRNPVAPEEVAVALYFYASSGEYQKALNLIEKEKPGLLAHEEVLDNLKRKWPKGLISVRIDEVLIAGDIADIKLLLNFSGFAVMNGRLMLIKEDNLWKVRLGNFY